MYVRRGTNAREARVEWRNSTFLGSSVVSLTVYQYLQVVETPRHHTLRNRKLYSCAGARAVKRFYESRLLHDDSVGELAMIALKKELRIFKLAYFEKSCRHDDLSGRQPG